MRKIILLFIVLISFVTNAQKQEVTYVNLKTVYDFQTEPNEYKLNHALKNKMKDLGYEVYFDKDIPQEVKNNPCLEYVANLTEIKSSTTTKLKLEITNCKGVVIFANVGVSRLKVHKKSYIDAFNKIFEY